MARDGPRPKKSWIWRITLAFIIIALLLGFAIVIWKIFSPTVFQLVFGEKWAAYEKTQQDLLENQSRLEEQVKDLEEKTEGKDAGAWPFLILGILALVAIGVIYALRNWRSNLGGKTKEQMDKLALEYVTKDKALEIKSFFSRMSRPIGGDTTSWHVWQGNFDPYTPGIDMPSHRCFTVATNNKDPQFVFEDFPNVTMDEVMIILENRHYGRGKSGLPHFKPTKDEPFEGMRLAETKAALDRLDDTARERMEE